jgi:hypothetical protein
VTASSDGTARVWDAATGNPLGIPLKHEQVVWSAAFSPDGARVVTASSDGTARVWDAATGNPLGVPLKHEKAVNSAAFSPDRARVVTASDDGTARVWDAATGNPLGIPLQHEQAVRSAAFSPDGARVVTASSDGTARVWDAATGNPLGIPLKHVKLHRSISTRLAILAAIEGRVAEARILQGPDAPATDARLLDRLGGVAHEDLHEEFVAVALLRRASEQDPGDPGILADLAETYFAAGQIEQFARTVAQIDQRRASPDVRVAIAALLWARGRLTGTAKDETANQLLRAYRESVTVTDANLQRSWNGTKHALAYGCHRFEDVKPIIDVLTLLEEPITDDTPAQLAKLLAAPARQQPNPQH